MDPLNRRVRILNGEFDPLTVDETVRAVFDSLAAGRRGWVSTVNVTILMAMRQDRMLQSYVERSAIVVADGQPLVWCARFLKAPLPERVTGIDLVDALCARAAVSDVAVFALGSTEPLLDRALATLRSRHPGLRISGLSGHYPRDAAAARVAAINASGARLLLQGICKPQHHAGSQSLVLQRSAIRPVVVGPVGEDLLLLQRICKAILLLQRLCIASAATLQCGLLLQ